MSFENTHMVADLIASSKLWIGDGYRAKNSELDSAGIPFARAGDINDGFHFTSGDHLPEEDAWKAGNKLSEAGDVVFTSKGTVGRFGFVTEGIQRFVYSPQLCFWRSLDYEAIYPRFLFYWIQGKEFYRQYKSVSQKTDMAEYVSLSDQRSMEITLPELSSQQAIAHILGTLDDKIELNRKTNEALEEIAKALFKSWFVDFDPVKAKAEGRPTGLPAEISDLFPDSFEDSELGDIPSGWQVQELGEISTISGGKQLEAGKLMSKGRFPVYGANGVMGFHNQTIHDSFVIVFGRVGAYCGSVKWEYGGAWVNNNASSVIPLKNEELVLQSMLEADFSNYRTGSAQPFIPNGALASSPVLMPTDAVATLFCDSIKSIRLNQKQNESIVLSLVEIRDALLPKLISGEIRIPDAEKMLEEVDI